MDTVKPHNDFDPVRIAALSDGERERVLLEYITQEAGVTMETRQTGKYSPRGDHGYHTIPSKRMLNIPPPYNRRLTIDQAERKLQERGVHEICILTRLTKEVPVERKREKLILGGLFRRREVYFTKEDQPATHADYVNGGINSEEAFCLTYVIEALRSAIQGPEEPKWVWNKRAGNRLYLDIVLPATLAQFVFKEIQRNPRFIRTIGEEVALKNMGIEEKDWFIGEDNYGVPMRPPYEHLASNKGGKLKMYIQPPDAKWTSAHQDPNPEWIIEVPVI